MLKLIRSLAIRLAGIKCVEGHYYLPQLITPSSVVIDGGCNYGRFAHDIIKSHGCHVLGVEPEANNLRQIPEHPCLTLFHGALGGYDGSATLHLAKESTAHRIEIDPATDGANSDEEKVTCKTLNSLMNANQWDSLDLLKLDIVSGKLARLPSSFMILPDWPRNRERPTMHPSV